MKRREFLKDASLLAAATAYGDVAGKPPVASCPVTLLAMPDYGRDLSREIAAVMSADGLVLKGKKVLLKPNFVEAHPARPINTNIAVIASAAHACLRLGAAEVIVGEASGHRRDPWFSVLNPSLRGILDKKVKCVDLNHGDAVSVPNAGRRTGLPVFYVARPVAGADILISMPKMKTHHWMAVTLCLKNLFGILPGVYYGWPKNLLHFRGIDNSILDLARTIKVHYNIIDGVVGMEGDGPIMGKAKPVGRAGPEPLPPGRRRHGRPTHGVRSSADPLSLPGRPVPPRAEAAGRRHSRGEARAIRDAVRLSRTSSSRCGAGPSFRPASEGDQRPHGRPEDDQQADGRPHKKARRKISQDDLVATGRNHDSLGEDIGLEDIGPPAIDPGVPSRGVVAGKNDESLARGGSRSTTPGPGLPSGRRSWRV